MLLSLLLKPILSSDNPWRADKYELWGLAAKQSHIRIDAGRWRCDSAPCIMALGGGPIGTNYAHSGIRSSDLHAVTSGCKTTYDAIRCGESTWEFARATGTNPFSFTPQIIYPKPISSCHSNVALRVDSSGCMSTVKPYAIVKMYDTSDRDFGGYVTGETFYKIVDAGHRTYALTGKSDNPWTHDILKVIAPTSGGYKLHFFSNGNWKHTCECVTKQMPRVNIGVAVTGATWHRIRAAGHKTWCALATRPTRTLTASNTWKTGAGLLTGKYMIPADALAMVPRLSAGQKYRCSITHGIVDVNTDKIRTDLIVRLILTGTDTSGVYTFLAITEI